MPLVVVRGFATIVIRVLMVVASGDRVGMPIERDDDRRFGSAIALAAHRAQHARGNCAAQRQQHSEQQKQPDTKGFHDAGG